MSYIIGEIRGEIYAQFAGKIGFLGIFGVKIKWIIGQKSQNSARYYKRILRKSLTSPLPPKIQYIPQIAPILSRIFLTFLPDNLKNTPDHRSKKSKKCPVLYSQFEENLLFGHFFLQIAPIIERFLRV